MVTSAERDQEKHDFELVMMYHPSLHVPDLDEARDFFARVFGASTRYMAPRADGYPTDYCQFTLVREVLFDTIDPTRYVLEGVQQYPDVDSPRLRGTSWYVQGIQSLYQRMRAAGVELVDQLGVPANGDEAPKSAGSPMPLFFTTPADAGMRYQLIPLFPFTPDPRVVDGWELPPVHEDDPLGVEYCSHHTFLTEHPDRARRLTADILGGTVIEEGTDEARGGECSYVRLADGVLQFLVPEAGTYAAEDASTSPHDVYHALTWKVKDLDRAISHLEREGVQLLTRTADTVVTDPRTSLGIPFGFTTRVLPGDDRARPW